MERAPELEDLTRRFYQALTQGDEPFIEELVSPGEGVLTIGTGPDEWVADRAHLRRALQAQTQELGDVQISPGGLRAYREGTVGWAADRPIFRLPSGSEFSLRVTIVFHQEGGAWKVVQSHTSVGVHNEDALPKQLAT